jgi:hypothetical protein
MNWIKLKFLCKFNITDTVLIVVVLLNLQFVLHIVINVPLSVSRALIRMYQSFSGLIFLLD